MKGVDREILYKIKKKDYYKDLIDNIKEEKQPLIDELAMVKEVSALL